MNKGATILIYVFLADGFEDIEALSVVDVLRRADLETRTVGIGSKNVTSSHKVKVECDITDKEARMNDSLEAIVLPGGMPGTLNLEKSEIVQSFIGYAVSKNIIIGAICAAPSILGHKNILNGRNAICFPGYEKDLKGAKISDRPVCRDGNIITAKGAGVAVDFGGEIVSSLLGEEKSIKVRKMMQCQI